MAQEDDRLRPALTAKRRLQDARRRLKEAEHELRATAVEATVQGVPVTHAAEALGINRVTMHRWLRDHERGTDEVTES